MAELFMRPKVADGQAEGLQQAAGFACALLFKSLWADVDVNAAVFSNYNRNKAARLCKVKR